MNTATTMGWVLACAFGIVSASISSANAQSTLGGAKPQQNKIGGFAKPSPVVGGANTHVSVTPKPPGPGVGMGRPGSPTPTAGGGPTQPGQTAGNLHVNPPALPMNKGAAVVTAPPKSPKP